MKLLATLLLILQLTQTIAQTNSEVEKAIKTFDAGEYDKGLSQMEKIVGKNPSNDNWDVLINLYYKKYEHAKRNSINSNNAEDENKTNTYFNDLITKCKTANLCSQSPLASQLLRFFFINNYHDGAVSEEAKNEFDEAEHFFKEKDYINTKLHYQKALNIQPDYYKATIYLGDSYWYLNKIDSAIYYFKKGIEMQPTILEPRIYLLEALILQKKNEEVKDEFIKALYVYPDVTMFNRFSDFCKKDSIKFNRQWVKRSCEVNVMGSASKKTNDKTWEFYANAKDEIKEYCDSDGIIRNSNNLTKEKYLEVYSWEKMLKNANPLPEELAFAKKMYDAGFLDCYVFISDFHFDCYNQFKDFAQHNKDKIKKYVETYLIEK